MRRRIDVKGLSMEYEEGVIMIELLDVVRGKLLVCCLE